VRKKKKNRRALIIPLSCMSIKMRARFQHYEKGSFAVVLTGLIAKVNKNNAWLYYKDLET
jgi:hypothetical protein